MPLEISVIIPCLNEIRTVAETIYAVSSELRDSDFEFEIILVDNGSTDGSDLVAINLGARVIYSNGHTVAAVRNMGAFHANGKAFVFLDADIVVQPNWGKALRLLYTQMTFNDNIITGSHPCVPDNIRPMLYSWYKAISEDTRDTHIGTGHMLVSKNTFNRIGGFEESLESGEDFDFCLRAKKIGIPVKTNSAMLVVHLGYPNRLFGFAKREIWHGEGDFKSWKTFVRSRAAICGALFLILNIAMVFSLAIHVCFFISFAVMVVAILAVVNLYKFGYSNARDFGYRFLICYIYLLSRGVSLLVSCFKKVVLSIKERN